MLDALELPREWLPPVRESTGDRAAPATRQAAARSAWASIGPGPLSVVLGTSGVVFAALPDVRGRPAGARARLLPRRARHLGRDGRDALAAGSLRWFRDALAPGVAFDELDAEAERWPPGAEGAALPPLPPGRAHAARRPRRARRVRRPVPPPRPRRARPRGARGRRVRAARLARAPARARCRSRRAARVSGGGARSRAVAADRRLGARAPARAHGRRGGVGVRRGAARRRREAASSPTPHEAVARCVRMRDRVEPDPAWAAVYDEGYARYRALYPALREVDGATVER